MSTTETHHALWVADASAGRYPSMEIAKNALHSRMIPGSDWPEFREH